jgi:hypothetical protein
MMNLKKLCSIFFLTLVLSTSALAGEMECPITSPTPATTVTTQENDTTTSSTSSTTGDATSGADASAAEAALSLVGTVLALF